MAKSGAKLSKPLVIWGVRAGLSAAALGLIFHFIPLSQVLEAARRISPVLWLTAVVVFLAGHLVSALKWRLLIGEPLSLALVFRAHLAGLAANLCLPGVAGGDVVRAGMVLKAVRSPVRLAAGSVADRILDTLSLGMVALIFGALSLGGGQAGLQLAASLLAAAILAIGLGLFACVRIDQGLRRASHEGRFAKLAGKLIGAGADLARRPARLVMCVAMSIAVQLVFIGVNVAFALSAGLKAPFAAWAFAWASAKIIAIAPISLGGLGVREASMAGLMTQFGLAAGDVVAVGLVWQTIIYASGLIGLLVQILATRSAPAPNPDAVQRPSL